MGIRRVSFALALLLLASIAWHIVEVHHEHPHFMGEGPGVALHASEDKMWFLAMLAVACLASAALVRKPAVSGRHVPLLALRSADPPRYFFGCILKRGHLHVRIP